MFISNSVPPMLSGDPALFLSLIPGQQEEGKKSRASIVSYTCHLCLYPLTKQNFSHVARASCKRGWEIWSLTRQPGPQLEPGVERAVVLLLKGRVIPGDSLAVSTTKLIQTFGLEPPWHFVFCSFTQQALFSTEITKYWESGLAFAHLAQMNIQY